jgi:general secretion pathway protein D
MTVHRGTRDLRYSDETAILWKITMNGRWLTVLVLVVCSPCLAVESSEEVSLEEFVDLYAKQESKDIVFNPRLKGMLHLRSGLTPGRITADEFYSVLLSRNFSAYEVDGLITIEQLGLLKQRKIPFYDGHYRGDLVTSQVVSSVIELRNRPATDLVPTLRPLVPQWGYLAADERSNSLAVVTTVGNVERLIELVEKLDR